MTATGRRHTATARAATYVLTVIDWAPVFLPALIVLAVGYRWATAFAVSF